MSMKLNPTTGKFDFDSGNFLGLLGSEPLSTIEGKTYINLVDNGYYIYYGGTWQLLHTLTAAAATYLLLEDSSFILLEDGSKLILN
jgi:hypothetical protein